VVQNLKIAGSNVFILLKLFVWHSSGKNVRMKKSNWVCPSAHLIAFLNVFFPMSVRRKALIK